MMYPTNLFKIRLFATLVATLTAVHMVEGMDSSSPLKRLLIKKNIDNHDNIGLEHETEYNQEHPEHNEYSYDNIEQRRNTRFEKAKDGLTLKVPYLVNMEFTKKGKYLFGTLSCLPFLFILYLVYAKVRSQKDNTQKTSQTPTTVNRKA